MDFILLLEILILLIPGFYYAYKQNFIFVFSKKYNIFPIQLMFTIPFFSGLGIVPIGIIYFLFTLIIPTYNSPFSTLSPYIGVILSLISVIIIIILFNKFVIEKENNNPQSEESELYLYLPFQRYYNFGGRDSGTKFSYPRRKEGDLLIGIQESDMIIEENELKHVNFAFTFSGAIIINRTSLQRLNEHNLTGFKTRPVRNSKTKSIIEDYFQLLPTHTMPNISDKTRIIHDRMIHVSKIIRDNKIFYD